MAGFVTLFVSLAGDARAADPEFTLVPDDEFFRPGENHSFQVSVSDADPLDTVTLNADDLPPGATFTPGASGNPTSGTFSWTPTSSQACLPFAVSFSASDGTSTTGWTTDLHVLWDSSSDCVSAIFPDESPTTGGTLVTLYGGDFEGDLSVTIAGVDVVALNRISQTKLTFVTPPSPTTGPVSLEVDGTNVGTIHYFTPSSAPPVFAAIPAELFVIVGGPSINLTVVASDPDVGDTVSLDASNLPAGAFFAPASGNPATSQLTWTPPLGSRGDYVVQFHATDGSGAPTTAIVEIHLLQPGAPIRIVGITPSRGPESGGTHVVVRGEGFPASPTVTVGGVSGLNVNRIDETRLEFDTPSNFCCFPGNADRDVVVAGTATLADGFHYFPVAPQVSIEDVSLANSTDVAFGVDARPGTLAEWVISDEDLGTADVTGEGNVLLDDFWGTLDTSLDLSDLTDGELTVTVTLTQGSDTSAATVTTAVKDTTPPVLSLPSNITLTASSTAGQAVTYTATADDARDGVVDVTCSPASGSVFPVGTTPVGCSAEDEFGNLASGGFSVSLTWSWSGILAPIVDGGTYKLGRVLPLKFGLTGASSGVTDVAATVTLRKVSDGVPGEPMLAEATGNANTGNQFRYDAATGQYTFNLATKGLTAGTYQVDVDLGDGVARSVTIGLAP